MNNLFDLSGRTGIVTGGAQGLGESIARALSAHGARVVLLDIQPEIANKTAAAINSERGEELASALACDVQNDNQVRSCVDRVREQHGRIDVLVNNAGVHRRHTPQEFPRQDIDFVLGVNLLGSFFVARAVADAMVEQRAGSIINLSALGGGLMGLGRGGSIYGVTKGAIVALTRDLAAEWGKHGIRVNSLAPGWIHTPMTQALQQNPARSAKMLDRVPLQRWGEALDVAGAAVFLASDASSYITGHTIPIDGGAANVISISED